MTYAFTLTTSAATANDLVKLKYIEKTTLRELRELNGKAFATSGGCA